MTRNSCWVLVATVLAVGCAGAPEQPAALANPAGEPAQTSSAAVAEVADVAVLDVNSLDPGTVVICRDMLKPQSNVIVTQCMSRDDWKRYERMQAMQAQQILRQMQGNAFP